MFKKFVGIWITIFFINLTPNTLQASSIDSINDGANKIINSITPKISIEVSVKGKKLKQYFENNSYDLSINDLKKKYQFKEKRYDVYIDEKLSESGKWKVYGLLKNQIRLKPDNGSKSYYFKKIKGKDIIHHFNKLPGSDNSKKTIVKIFSLNSQTVSNDDANIEPKKEKKVVKKIDNSGIKKEKKKKDKKKVSKKEKKKKDKKKKKKTKSKYKFIELSKNQIKELDKYKKDSKNIRIIKSEDSYIHTTKRGKEGMQTAQYVAAEHCAKNNLFVYSFKDSGYGVWYEPPFKRAKYFYCTDQLIFVNPFTAKEVTWTNYEDESYFKFPDKHLFLYRKMSRTYQKLFEKEKKNNPKKFKTKPFKIVYKDENSIHIKGSPLGDLNIERYLANEHCSKFNKKYYFFEDSHQQGTFGSISFHCSDKYLTSNPLSGLPLQFASGSENYSPSSTGQSNLDASQMLKYNSTSKTTYQFFEASDNLMKSLELLYRAYDKNVEADKLKAQISYNRESKYSEQDKLSSTTALMDDSSVEINAKITDESIVLSDEGRIYFQQSLPYAYDAAQSSYNLVMTIKETFEKGTQGGESFLQYANEFIGFFTIAKDLPKLAKDIFTTSKLVFSAAKTKKIKDKGNLGDALDELELSA